MSLKVGQTLGGYHIVEQLGQGGMATVFKAHHAALDRYVAIKVLHAAFKEDPTFQARFQREARVVARLDHPHIVPVYDYAEFEGAPYLVMKFIEGETLKARLLRGPVSALEVLRYVEALGSALEYAHRQGILHRDIKPSNVMLAKDGTIYLADFGLARIAQAGESTLSADSMLGTPQYMSPEQARGVKELDAGTDLYSLGVVIYELLVGRAPFLADTPFAVIHDHIYTPLPAPRAINPQVPVAVEAVLLKALAKERSGRYTSAAEMVAAFREAMAPAIGAPVIAPARTPPADPTAVTPPTATVVAPAAGTFAAATQAAPASATATAEPTVVRSAAGGRRQPSWLWAAAGGLVLVLCLSALVVARMVLRAASLAPPTPTLAATVTVTHGPAPTATPAPSTAITAPGATAPAEVSVLLGKAQSSLAAGQLDQALGYLDQAVGLDPSDAKTFIQAGDLLLASGHTLGALDRYYRPAAALEGEHPSDVGPVLQAHVSLAFYVAAADETSKEFLEGQAEANPDQVLPVLALNRYHIFFDQGAGVLDAMTAILDKLPNHEGALLTLGDYYLSNGQEALATRFYQRVRNLPRPASRAGLNWGELEARCNLEKLRRLRSAAILEATCEDLSLLLTGK